MFQIKELRYKIMLDLDIKSLSRIKRISKNIIGDDFWPTKVEYDNLTIRNGDDDWLIELDRLLNARNMTKSTLQFKGEIVLKFGKNFHKFTQYLSIDLRYKLAQVIDLRLHCRYFLIDGNTVDLVSEMSYLSQVMKFERKEIIEMVECAYYINVGVVTERIKF